MPWEARSLMLSNPILAGSRIPEFIFLAPGLLLNQRMNDMIKFAKMLGRLVARLFVARSSDHFADSQTFCAREFADERIEPVVVLEQTLTPLLGQMQQRGLLARRRLQGVELLDDRGDIDIAHEAPDVLALALPCGV